MHERAHQLTAWILKTCDRQGQVHRYFERLPGRRAILAMALDPHPGDLPRMTEIFDEALNLARRLSETHGKRSHSD